MEKSTCQVKLDYKTIARASCYSLETALQEIALKSNPGVSQDCQPVTVNEVCREVCLLDANGDLNCPISSFYCIFLSAELRSYCFFVFVTSKFICWKCSRCYLIFCHGFLLQYGKPVAVSILLLISILISRITLIFECQAAHLLDDFPCALSSHLQT